METPKHLYQILGTVIDAGKKREPVRVKTQLGNICTVSSPHALPLRVGDIVDGYCHLRDDQYVFVRLPSTLVGVSKDALCSTLRRAGLCEREAEALYEYMVEDTKIKIKHYQYGDSKLVYRHRHQFSLALLENICWHAEYHRYCSPPIYPLDAAKARKVLWRLYDEICVRRLRLLGLTKSCVRECAERFRLGRGTLAELYHQLLTNPYLLEKVPMEAATNIAKAYGLSFDDEILRCAEVVRYADEILARTGSVCVPWRTLVQRYPDLPKYRRPLLEHFGCAIRYDSLYLHYHDQVEEILVDYFKPGRCAKIPLDSTDGMCDEQVRALECVLSNRVAIVTGSAGTGKTTIISRIVRVLESRDMRYRVTAYTGKAVSNITRRIPNVHASTIHMLMVQPEILDVLIIDEVSMVPNGLLARVVHLAPRLIMLGDPQQLPPIEGGDLLSQLLQVPIPRVHLTIDHRRSEHKTLFDNLANFGKQEFVWGDDCLFCQGDMEQVRRVVRKVYKSGIPHTEITVLCPINAPLVDINLACRKIFLGDGVAVTDDWKHSWRVGDRVVMTVNDYKIEVMNGEEGIITAIDRDKAVVRFGSRRVELSLTKTKEMSTTKRLRLAWATTVHKAQGSQWKYVILYIPKKMASKGFFNKNLVYTAISRAQEILYVVAKHETLFLDALGTKANKRYDYLGKRLVDTHAYS